MRRGFYSMATSQRLRADREAQRLIFGVDFGVRPSVTVAMFPAPPPEPDEYTRAVDAWLTYYRATEAFDRTLPGAPCPYGSGWRPHPRHMRESSAYANHLLRQLRLSLLSPPDALRAKLEALMRHEEELRRG